MRGGSLIKRIEGYYKDKKDNSLYFYPLAVLYAQRGEREKALDILLEGLKRFPRYELALLKIAELLLEGRKYEAALAYIETLLTVNPCNAKANFLAGMIYDNLGDHNKAAEFYRKASSIDPINYGFKAVDRNDEGEPGTNESDKNDLNGVPTIELEDDEQGDDIATVMLARLYEQQGYVDDAIATYRKVLAIDPENEEARKAIERLEGEKK